MKKDFSLIKEYQKDLHILGDINSVLHWDRETIMPIKGIESRSEQSALVSEIIHKKATSKHLFRSLKRLKESKIQGDNKLMINKLYKDIEKSRKLPPKFVKELAKTANLTTLKWREAKQKNNFKKFEPYLKKIVELKQQESSYIGLKGHPYNSLLDSYEEGMTTEKLKPLFNGLKKSLTSLHKKIEKSSVYKNDNGEHSHKFSIDKQKELCEDVIKKIGLKQNNSIFRTSTHPFTLSLGLNDVRITTSFNRNLLFSFIATMHEAGHALYELNLPKKHKHTIFHNAASYGAHESQSKFWENMIGKNKPFWKYYFPKFDKKFNLETNFNNWYRYVNKIKSDPIRVTSDEIAYPLHIILRFEIETGLIDGSIKVKELPSIWNKKMKDYLNIKPKNNSEGLLQDIHWSWGAIGYFPTYAIGTIYAAQLYKKLLKDKKNIEIEIEKGNFNDVAKWLNKNFHEYGNTLTSEEIMKKTCKQGLNPEILVKYLKKKYSQIYKI